MSAQPSPKPEIDYIDPREFADLKRASRITGQSRTYIYDHMKDKDDPFPASISIGSRVFWRCADLFAWNDRKAGVGTRATKTGSKP